MKALIFIQNLKQTVLDIERCGGNEIFYVEPDYNLIQKLKAHSLSKLREIGSSDHLDFLGDLLSRDIFNLRITLVSGKSESRVKQK
jgi:hypothetical protein